MNYKYTSDIPNADNLFALYESEQWNDFLKLSKEKLYQAMAQSWFVVCVYHDKHLIGMGRIVSDGVINAYLCGVLVMPRYRGQGIGTEIIQLLVDKCKTENLHIQLFSEEHNKAFYESINFEQFAIGFKYKN